MNPSLPELVKDFEQFESLPSNQLMRLDERLTLFNLQTKSRLRISTHRGNSRRVYKDANTRETYPNKEKI